MIIYTIGFTKKSAEEFFEILRRSGAKHLLDIRLDNMSQMAGFTKWNRLPYFLKEIVNMEYHEASILAPEKSLRDEYRETKDWTKYERTYLELIRRRQVELHMESSLFEDGVVLLCSEVKPDRCHRRLAADYLVHSLFPGASVEHL